MQNLLALDEANIISGIPHVRPLVNILYKQYPTQTSSLSSTSLMDILISTQAPNTPITIARVNYTLIIKKLIVHLRMLTVRKASTTGR